MVFAINNFNKVILLLKRGQHTLMYIEYGIVLQQSFLSTSQNNKPNKLNVDSKGQTLAPVQAVRTKTSQDLKILKCPDCGKSLFATSFPAHIKECEEAQCQEVECEYCFK